MTREEQIDKFAQSKMDSEFWDESLYEGIVVGAKWVDRTIIEKACEMLYAMLSEQEINDYDYVTAPAYDNVVDFIEDFRKAMEE